MVTSSTAVNRPLLRQNLLIRSPERSKFDGVAAAAAARPESRLLLGPFVVFFVVAVVVGLAAGFAVGFRIPGLSG